MPIIESTISLNGSDKRKGVSILFSIIDFPRSSSWTSTYLVYPRTPATTRIFLAGSIARTKRTSCSGGLSAFDRSPKRDASRKPRRESHAELALRASSARSPKFILLDAQREDADRKYQRTEKTIKTQSEKSESRAIVRSKECARDSTAPSVLSLARLSQRKQETDEECPRYCERRRTARFRARS